VHPMAPDRESVPAAIIPCEQNGAPPEENLISEDDKPDPPVIHHTSGWLWMRARFTKKWKKRWFLLDKNYLRYGDCENKLSGRILLDGSKIRETAKDDKQFAFSIESKSGHRIYYLQAEDGAIRNKWMHAMCFAKFSHGDGESTSLCTIS